MVFCTCTIIFSTFMLMVFGGPRYIYIYHISYIIYVRDCKSHTFPVDRMSLWDENLAGGLPVERLRVWDSGDSSGIGRVWDQSRDHPSSRKYHLDFLEKIYGKSPTFISKSFKIYLEKSPGISINAMAYLTFQLWNLVISHIFSPTKRDDPQVTQWWVGFSIPGYRRFRPDFARSHDLGSGPTSK